MHSRTWDIASPTSAPTDRIVAERPDVISAYTASGPVPTPTAVSLSRFAVPARGHVRKVPQIGPGQTSQDWYDHVTTVQTRRPRRPARRRRILHGEAAAATAAAPQVRDVDLRGRWEAPY